MSLTVKIDNRIYRFEDAEIDTFLSKIRNGQIKPGFSILGIGCKG